MERPIDLGAVQLSCGRGFQGIGLRQRQEFGAKTHHGDRSLERR